MARRELRPHTVLITGASDGIGFLLAQNYARSGHLVLATGRQLIKDDAAFFGSGNITYVRADQADPQHAARVIARAMSELGWTQLDLAVLNAGTGWTGHPADEPIAQVREQIAVNLAAPITITKALAPWLFVDQGTLVLIGSTAVAKGNGRFATYVATKAGLEGFARSLREEWRGRASVLLIHPGPTRTAMHGKAGLNAGAMKMFFMSPKRAAKAVQLAIRKGQEKRSITRLFGWRAAFFRAKEGRL